MNHDPHTLCDSRPHRRSQAFDGRWIAVVVGIVIVAVTLEWPRAFTVIDAKRVYCDDPDDYTRLIRVRELLEQGPHVIRRMATLNAPAGFEPHWTAPMDWLLAAAAVVARPFIHHPDPLGVSAAAVPTLLGAAYVAVLMTFVARLAGRGPGLIAGALIAVSPAFHRAFAFGHCDHHALLELLFAIGMFALIPARGRGCPGNPTIIGSGIALGLAIWIAPQAMLFWLAVLSGLIVNQFGAEIPDRLAWGRLRRTWAVAAAAVIAIGHVVENAPHFDAAALDKISLTHVILAALTTLIPVPPDRFSAPTTASTPAGHRRSWGYFVLGLVGCTAWLAWHRADLLPFARTPEFYRYSATIAELQPLYTHAADGAWSLAKMHARLGFLPYVLPIFVIVIFRDRHLPVGARLTLGAFAPLLLGMTLLQTRWLDHVNLFAVPVVAVGADRLIGRIIDRIRPGPTRAGALSESPSTAPIFDTRVLAALLLCGAIVYPAAQGIVQRSAAKQREARTALDRTAFVADAIRAYDAAHPDAAAGTILSDDTDGPMLAYETRRPVVAAPFHRALFGILEMSAFFAERDPIEARRRLDRLGVRYVVVPIRIVEQLLNFETLLFGTPSSYDPPVKTLDADGQVHWTPHYRPVLFQTMAYRLSLTPGDVIPGVRLIGRIREGAPTPDGLSGLLYVVEPSGD